MKMDHLQLAMPKGCEDQAREFFSGVLEMDEIPKPEPLKSRGGCWFQKANVQLHLGIESPFIAQVKAHPAFCIENLDALANKLDTQGYKVSWDDSIPNRKRFYTADPFGNRLEFLQEGDGFNQR